MVRAVDKADATLTLSSALYIGSHVPFILFMLPDLLLICLIIWLKNCSGTSTSVHI